MATANSGSVGRGKSFVAGCSPSFTQNNHKVNAIIPDVLVGASAKQGDNLVVPKKPVAKSAT